MSTVKSTSLKWFVFSCAQEVTLGNSLAVQWLGPCASTAGGTGSIPGRGTKIPKAVQCSQKKKWLYYFNKSSVSGFPGGAVVENLPASAGDTGSSPGLGGSHVPRSNWAREPPLLSLRVWSLCSATGEAAIMRDPRTAMKSGPHLPQLEKALAQKRRPNTAIN